ncbi:Crp/Fnr family transcriptional regulator [Marivita sp. S0852]|uniref:Crp/Fnr family transcriptional regulator n=1 Tax=Marivita sp. S0852 TaxID=3373893 RepID=UPI0039822272
MLRCSDLQKSRFTFFAQKFEESQRQTKLSTYCDTKLFPGCTGTHYVQRPSQPAAGTKGRCRMDCMFETACEAAIFQHVSKDNALNLIKNSVMRRVNRGASIFLQGEAAHSLFIVLDGWIKTYRMTPCGNEAVVGVFTKSDTFGEEAAVPDQTFLAGAEAVTEAAVLQIESEFLSKAMAEDLALCQSMLSGALHQKSCLVQHVEQLKSHTAGQRIADFLLSLCRDEKGNCTVILPYDKVLIAAWLGMKPESLSRAFRRLRLYGVTIKKNHAVIESVERLLDYADEDPAEAWSARV